MTQAKKGRGSPGSLAQQHLTTSPQSRRFTLFRANVWHQQQQGSHGDKRGPGRKNAWKKEKHGKWERRDVPAGSLRQTPQEKKHNNKMTHFLFKRWEKSQRLHHYGQRSIVLWSPESPEAPEDTLSAVWAGQMIHSSVHPCLVLQITYSVLSTIFAKLLLFLISCRPKACHSFPEAKLTSLHRSFYPSNSPKSRQFHFTTTEQ